MRRVRGFVGSLALLAAACSEFDEPSGWTRVVEIGEEGQYYSFVHADRDADVCVTLNLGPPAPGEIDDVLVKGGNFVVGAGWGRPYEETCTNPHDYYSAGDNSVTGKITFDDFRTTDEGNTPCSVSFELEIEGLEGKLYRMSARKFPILDVGCPRPGVYVAEYTQLDAAVGAYEGTDTLVISAWDSTREGCVWARLSTDPELPSSDVDVPDAWVYSGMRFGLTEQAACTAEQLVRPPINPEYATESVGELGSTGSVRFVQSGGSGWPCVIDVDLDLRSRGRFDWTPDDVHMRAVGVPVVGGCD